MNGFVNFIRKKFLSLTVILMFIVILTQGWYIISLTRDTGGESRRVPIVEADKQQPSVWDNWLKQNTPNDTWDPFLEMEERMNKMFDSAFDRFGMGGSYHGMFQDNYFSPNIDLDDEGDRYIIRVDLPGANNENISVSLKGRVVTISGTITEERQKSGLNDSFLRSERRSGNFSRSITLPAPVKTEEMTTDLKDGVYTVTIPKQ